MPGECMDGKRGCFVVTVAVEVSPVVFKMLIDLESAFGGGTVFEQEVGAGGHQVFMFKPVAGIKHPFYLQHFFGAGIYGIYFHAVVERKLFAGFQVQVKFNGVFNAGRNFAVECFSL